MHQLIIVEKDIDLDNNWFYEEDNSEGYTKGYNLADGWYWFDSWEYACNVAENDTISGILDQDNFIEDLNEALELGYETEAETWEEYCDELLDSGYYQLIQIHK